MKKTLFALVILLSSVSAFGAFGESQYFEAKLGADFPWVVQPGIDVDITYGLRVDQIVSINFDVGYYFTSYNQVAPNSTPINGLQSTSLLSSLNANLLRFLVNARIDMPFITIAEIVVPYAQVGVGANLMINGYQSTNTSDNSTVTFSGLALKLDIGTRIKLGDRSALIIDLGYNFCQVSKWSSALDKLNVGQIIDVSGFSLLGGISFQI